MQDAGIARYFTGASKTWSYVTDKTLEMANRVSAGGKSAIPYWKPMAIGTSAAIGLATVLSEPPLALNMPQRTVMPNLNSGSGGAFIGQGMHPDSEVGGNPTVPSMVGASNTARVAPNYRAQNMRIQINAQGNGQTNYSQVSSSIQNAVGASSMNTNISDRRQSLTAQKISDMITRG